MTRLPQVLLNVPVTAPMPDAAERFAAEITAVEAELGDRGRVLVRPSGTEPLVRVMVEAPTQPAADDAARRLADRSSPPPDDRGRARLAWRPMCGIVGVVSRPPTRPTPTADELLGGLDAALAARGDVAAVTAAAAGVDDARCTASPGCSPCIGDEPLVAAITARLDQLDAYAAELDARAGAHPRRRRAGGGERRLDRPARRPVGAAPGPPAHRRRGRRPRRPGRRAGCPRRLPRDPAGVVGDRPHGGPRPRLRRHPRLRLGPRPRRRRPDDRRRARRPSRRRRSSRAVPSALAGRCLSFVYKAAAEIGELGDNTRAMRAAVRADDLLRRALAGARAPASPCSATPAGPASASSPSPTPTRSTATRSSGTAARRRRSSSACSTATSTTTPTCAPSTGCASPARSPPTPRSSRRSSPATHGVGGDLFEAFRRTVVLVRGLGRHRRGRRRRARPLYLALNGSGQGVYIGLADDRFLVASEPYGVVEETDRYVRLDGEHGGQIVAPRRRRRRHARGHRAPRLRRLRPAGHRGRRRAGRGHDARHRPRRPPALPAQGDHRVAGQLRQDAARQDRRATTGGCAPSSDGAPCRPTSRTACAAGRSRASA